MVGRRPKEHHVRAGAAPNPDDNQFGVLFLSDPKNLAPGLARRHLFLDRAVDTRRPGHEISEAASEVVQRIRLISNTRAPAFNA